jgi:hypothetical protein
MLSWDERILLYGLARDHCPGPDPAIVDAGCFVGGSTLALASGLADRGGARPGTIHTYDRLLVEEYSRDGYFPDREVGSSLRPVFEANLAPHRELVLHEGDVVGESCDPSAPIAILFLDLCKSWQLNRHVNRTFLPALVPGSMVVQQDLVHWGYPWCAITMEVLADHFDYLGWAWYASSLWRLKTRIALAEADLDWRDGIPLARGLDLLDRAAARTDGHGPAMLELAKATLQLHHARRGDALVQIDSVERRYGTSVPYIDRAYASLREWAAGGPPQP